MSGRDEIRMNWLKYLGLTLLISALAPLSFAQTTRQKAFDYLDKGEIKEAQQAYLELLETEGNDPLLCFETGIAFYKGDADDQKQAIKYFELSKQYSEANDTVKELNYYLGRSYQYDHRCEEAMSAYERFKPLIRGTQAGDELKLEVEEYIRMCQHCIYHKNLNEVDPLVKYERRKDQQKFFISDEKYILLENMGEAINTDHADYASIFFNNEEYMIFTSRRREFETDQAYDDGKFYEDIYLSHLVKDRWTLAVEVDQSNLFSTEFVGHDLHDATISMSPKEDHMYLYKDHQIYKSENVNGVWAEGELYDEKINEKDARVSSAFLSEDENMLIIASDRPKGYGEHDLYYFIKQSDGSWGDIQNFGAVINTENDEESPYLTKDGNRLYFSSRGHSSIGGYDVFYSDKKEDGNWTTPVNLGIPINTPNDELHYLISEVDKEYAYYSSNRAGGYGDFDIYRISENLASDDSLYDLAMADIIYIDSILTEVELRRGKKYTDRVERYLQDGKITPEEIIEENFTGAYDILDDKTRRQMDSTYFAEIGAEELEKARLDSLENIEAGIASKIEQESSGGDGSGDGSGSGSDGRGSDGSGSGDTGTMGPQEIDLFANIEFGFNQATVPGEHRKQLDILVEHMKKNPNFIMHLSGHTDDIGSNDMNNQFSRQRAMVIYNYLIDEGIDPKRIKYEFFGESKPLVANNSDANRAKNRRVELEVEKFAFYRHINYGIASDYLNDEAMKTLDEAISYYKSNGGKTIELNGYADITGAISFNKALSRRRAEGAKLYMVGRAVPAANITYQFFGTKDPVRPNNTEETRRFNRRVEVLIK